MVEQMEEIERKPRKSTSFSGRNIIEEYLTGKPTAVKRYNQMTASLAQFSVWDDESKTDFLRQFMDTYDIIDMNCREIVSQFCNMRWTAVPASMVESYVEFLSLIAVHHISHVGPIFRCILQHFTPEMKMAEAAGDAASAELVPSLTDEAQEKIYNMAHACLLQIIACVPLSVHVLLKCCQAQYPFHRLPNAKLLAFNRNMILLSENVPPIAEQLWSLIIERLLHLDIATLTSRLADQQNLYDTDKIFAMDSESSSAMVMDASSEVSVDQKMEAKLDLLIAQILHYIAVGQGHDDSKFLGTLRGDINFKWIDSLAKHNLDLFHTTMAGFENYILYTSDVHSVSYIWFYLCGLNPDICDAMLKSLWRIMTEPQRSPNDWKKAQNAAASMCGFLARADYVSFKVASAWLKKMADWCCAYVDNAVKVFSGGIQHGTFYAVVQSLLFVLCYRYREFHNLEEIHLWGLGRIVHSKLEPLRFISQAVALCFANVSRHLQIVYCNHILSSNGSSRQRPVELYFPFSFCNLSICSSKILPMMRKFTPIEELETHSDVGMRKRIASTSADADVIDFGEIYGEEYDFMEGGSFKSDKIKILLESITQSPLTQFSAVDRMSP